MSERTEVDGAALALSVRETAVLVARAVLAVRRGDRAAAECYLIRAQRELVTIDRALPRARE